MLLITTGTVSITDKNGTAILTGVAANLQVVKPGTVVDFPGYAIGSENVDLSALFKLFVGGYDDNPGTWLLQAGQIVTYTSNKPTSMLNGKYIIVALPPPREGNGLDYVEATLARMTKV